MYEHTPWWLSKVSFGNIVHLISTLWAFAILSVSSFQVPGFNEDFEFGQGSFTIPGDAIRQALGYSAMPVGSCLEVTAYVQDITSLRLVQGKSKACFVSQTCRVNASYLDAVVKTGLPYSSQVGWYCLGVLLYWNLAGRWSKGQCGIVKRLKFMFHFQCIWTYSGRFS